MTAKDPSRENLGNEEKKQQILNKLKQNQN